MAPYFVIVVASCVCAVAAFSSKGKNPVLYGALSFAAIAALCVFAAVRDPGVGQDMLVYGDRVYQLASRSTLSDCLFQNDIEPLFNLLAFVCANVANSKEVYYFAIQLLICAPTYFAISQCFDDSRYQSFAWLLFCLIMFPYGLNLMRQAIAISFCTLAFFLILRKRYIASLAFVAIAMGFHLSAVVSLAFYPLSKAFDKGTATKAKILLSAFACILVIFFSESAIQLLPEVKDTYSYQVDHLENYDIQVVALGLAQYAVIYAPFILMVMLNYGGLVDRNPQTPLFVSVFLAGVLLFQLGAISNQMFRVSLYFVGLNVFAIPKLIQSIECGYDRSVYACATVIFLVLYFSIMIQRNGNIVPYTSHFLGIE